MSEHADDLSGLLDEEIDAWIARLQALQEARARADRLQDEWDVGEQGWIEEAAAT